LQEAQKSAEEIKKIIKDLKERKITYQGYASGLEASGETQKSLTDPESRLMLANGKMDVCYNVQTAVDAKNKLIAEFEVTNNPNDKNLLTPMAEQVKETLCADSFMITADKGYASACDVASAMQIGVAPHVAGVECDICIPVKGEQPPEITSQVNGKCVYLKERNIAICPMGKVLYPAYYKKAKGEAVFNNRKACKTCICRCSTERQGLRFYLVMDESDFSTKYNEEELVVKQVHIKANKEIYKQRKSLSEHPFGTVKRSMDCGYCLVKGKEKLTGEFALIFLAYNFKRVINILGVKRLLETMSSRASLFN